MSARPVPPPPVVVPLTTTSPSLAAAMRRCMLRVAFSRSSQHRALVGRSAAARLGSACHAVLEAVGAGALDEAPPALWEAKITELWESAVAAQAEEASQSIADSSLGPPHRWPYYSLRYAQVRRVALQLAKVRAASITSSAGETLAAVSFFAWRPSQAADLVEVPLVGFGGKLKGQADRIEVSPDSVCIEDYKSGAIFDQTDGAEPEVLKSDYRLQLLLYAALYHAQAGIWPDRARVVPLRGQPVEIVVDPCEATQAAEDALALLDAYNEAAKGGTAWDLARPSPETCRSCGFRGMCDAYWAAASAAWEAEETPSCEGETTVVQLLGDGSVLLKMRADAGTVSGDIRVRGLTPAQAGSLKEGDWVRLVRLRRRQGDDEQELWAGAGTEIWVLRGSVT